MAQREERAGTSAGKACSGRPAFRQAWPGSAGSWIWDGRPERLKQRASRRGFPVPVQARTITMTSAPSLFQSASVIAAPSRVNHPTSHSPGSGAWLPVEEPQFPQHRELRPHMRQAGDPVHQHLVSVCPIEPGGVIVLRIGIVVAALAAAKLVPGGQHDGATRGEQGRQQGLDVTAATCHCFRVAARALDTIVPRNIVVVPVAIVFAVGGIVFVFIGHEIVQAESINGPR